MAAIANAAPIGKSGQIQWINKPTPITVVMTNPNAIIITGLIYFLKWTLETLTPSTNNKGAIIVTINNSESKLNWTGIGVINSNMPKKICINARGTLGMKVWTNELSITTAINIRIVSNISKLSPL